MKQEQTRKLIEQALISEPGRSDREIGRELGCDGKTVGAVRKKLAAVDSPNPSGRTGAIADADPPPESPDAPALVSTVAKPAQPHPRACKVCSGLRYWQSGAGYWHCHTCRPPRNSWEVFQAVEFL